MTNTPYMLLLVISFFSCQSEGTTKKQLSAYDSTAIQQDTAKVNHSSRIKSPSKLDLIEKTNANNVFQSGDDVNKAYVRLSAGDSSIHISANMRLDHRIFGFDQPNTNSKRLFLFSIFTDDVKDNPFNFPLGAYYDSSDLTSKDLTLHYIKTSGDFIEASLSNSKNKIKHRLYFEKKWIEIE